MDQKGLTLVSLFLFFPFFLFGDHLKIFWTNISNFKISLFSFSTFKSLAFFTLLLHFIFSFFLRTHFFFLSSSIISYFSCSSSLFLLSTECLLPTIVVINIFLYQQHTCPMSNSLFAISAKVSNLLLSILNREYIFTHMYFCYPDL